MDRISKLKEFLESNENDSFIQHALALEYVKAGDDGEARRLFEKLLLQNEDYVGTYYHLGKLLERSGERENALRWYERGMLKAKELGDQHAYNELQAAFDDLA